MSAAGVPRVEASLVADTSSPPYAELRETHSGLVILLGDRAYKLKKPVDLGFLDFSTPEQRLDACRREVILNRRLAQDVYLGIAEVTDVDHRVMEHLVVMRRMPAEFRLSQLVRRGIDLRAQIRGLARLIVTFHSRCARSATISREGDRAALSRRWDSNIAGARSFSGSVLDRERLEEVARLASRFLAGRQPLFTNRVQRGAVVDGHGDLLAEDIFCLPDGPRVLDCLEFDDRLRYLDRLDDIACLAMDLEHLGVPGLGRHFVECCVEFSGERAPESLIHHYIAYRAFMRAKVTCLRHAQSGQGRAEARLLLDQAYRHLTEGQVHLVLVGGAPGTGKSVTAAGLADKLGFTTLSSDRVRKELAGVAAETSRAASYEAGIYTRAWTERTYVELMRRAELLLAMGESVVLDATWSTNRSRSDAARLADATSSQLSQLRCDVADSTADERISRRTSSADPSDADPEIASSVRRSFQTWADAVVIDTTESINEAVASAVRVVRPPTATSRFARSRMAPD